MSKSPKAVIFDMDGIIVDTEPIQSQSIERLLHEYGISPIYQDNGLIHTVGISGDESYHSFMKKHNFNENLKIVQQKRRKIFEDIIKEGIVPMQGFTQLIKLLQKQKIKIGLASNRRYEHIILILEQLNIKEHFWTIVGPSEKRKHKPAPDIYLDAAKELEVSPKECIVIEDSETGIFSAKSAGMKIIAVPNPYTNHHDFSNADKIVSSLSDINMSLLQNL